MHTYYKSPRSFPFSYKFNINKRKNQNASVEHIIRLLAEMSSIFHSSLISHCATLARTNERFKPMPAIF